MATGSTKSRRDGRLGDRDEAQLPDRAWLGANVAVLIVAAVFRLVALELKPMHHDEGVNAGYFLLNLVRRGSYVYDPTNYHGPTLYYFALFPAKLFGLHTWTVRLTTALFGIATVWLFLYLRRRIGVYGALAAAALLAVSPGATFLARYFIHETLFVFFALGALIAFLRYLETANARDLYLSAASLALFFATKETAFITVGTMSLAALLAFAWTRPDKRQAAMRDARTPLVQRVGGASVLISHALGALFIFLSVNVLFYSSFFTNPKGIGDAVASLSFWTKTGRTDHIKPFATYLWWMLAEEAPLLIFGAVGAALALWHRRNSFAVFASFWAWGTFFAYSLIPYKTPWLMLNFIVPLAIVAGYAVNELAKQCARKRSWALHALFAATIVASAYQAVQLNFVHYDDENYPYVYVHTQRDFLRLVERIEELSARAGTGLSTHIAVLSPDYWPLPWYLRDFAHVSYYGKVVQTSDQLVIASAEEREALRDLLGNAYASVGVFALRPGVELELYVRRGRGLEATDGASLRRQNRNYARDADPPQKSHLAALEKVELRLYWRREPPSSAAAHGGAMGAYGIGLVPVVVEAAGCCAPVPRKRADL